MEKKHKFIFFFKILTFCCLINACQNEPKITFINEIVQTQPLPNRPFERSTYKHYLAHQIVENSTRMHAMKMGEDIANDRFCYCINNSIRRISEDMENRDFMVNKMFDICKEQAEKEVTDLINAQVTPQFKSVIKQAYDEVAAGCEKDYKKKQYGKD